jgi:hypothetical protein
MAMKLGIYSVIGLFSISTIVSNELSAAVYKCTDAQGQIYFSDISCPPQMVKEVMTIDRSPAVSASDRQGHSVVEQVNALERAQAQQANRKREEYERFNAARGQSWNDEVASKNALRALRYEENSERVDDAAEQAIRYNAESAASGGRHQVRVPDVTNIHIHQ